MMKDQGSNIKFFHLLLLLWLLRKKKINIHVNEFLIYCINTSRQKRLTNFIKILQMLQALQNQQLNKNTHSQHPPFQHQRKQNYQKQRETLP